MNEKQKNELYEALSELSGEEVLQLFMDYHGMQLLTREFAEHCQGEGKIDLDWLNEDEDDEEEE